jgi:hypothetical protein
MSEVAVIEPNEDVYDFKDVELIEKAYQQLQFFDSATKDDFRKTLFLLSMYRALNEMIENYEFVLNEAKEEGPSSTSTIRAQPKAGVSGSMQRI